MFLTEIMETMSQTIIQTIQLSINNFWLQGGLTKLESQVMKYISHYTVHAHDLYMKLKTEAKVRAFSLQLQKQNEAKTQDKIAVYQSKF